MDIRHLRRSTGVTPTSAGRIILDRRDLALAAAVALLAALVFAPSLGGRFTGYDDTLYTTLNPHLSSPDGLARIWLSGESPQYYPITFTVYWLAAHLFGDSAASYHAVNLAVHALNAGLVFLLVRSLGLTRGPALFAAALFAVHPVQVMSVAWIAGLKNMLSTFFCLICLMSWRQFRAKQSESLYTISLICFAAALLSKSAILLLPLALLTIDRLIFFVPWRTSIIRLLPMLVLGALSVAATSGFEKPFILRAPDPLQRPLIAAAGYFFYIYKLLWPADLAPFYPFWKVSAQSIAWWIPVAGCIAIAAIIWRARTKQRGLIAISAIIFFAMILPASGLVVFGNLAWTCVSDHYLYFACLGPFVFVAIAAQWCASRSFAARNGTLAIASILLIPSAVKSVRYTPVFYDGQSLWTHTLTLSPDCIPAHAGLGQLYAARKKWPLAIEHFQKARTLIPEEMDILLSLGEAQIGAGDFQNAEKSLREVLARQPQRTAAILQLGIVAEKTGRYAEAREQYRRCLEINPADANPHVRLGRLCLGLMERDEASVHFRMANRLNPREPWGYGGLAACWRGLGRYADAIAVLRQGVAALPGDMGMLDALARLLATAPDDKVRNGAEALELAVRACDATKRNEPDLLDTLAAAFAELGRFDEALAAANQAVTLAETRGDSLAANKLRSHADRYAQRQPLREAPMQRRR